MSTTIIFSIHDPEEISAMMTQASEDTQNELTSQGDRLKNQISNTFGCDELQSQLSLGYQSICTCMKYVGSNFPC